MGIYIPNTTLKDIKEHPTRFLIGSKGVTLEVTDVYGYSLSENFVQEVAAHGRLIDLDTALNKLIHKLGVKSLDYLTPSEKAIVDIFLNELTVIEAEE